MAYTTIDDPSAHFQANAYSGSSNPQTITNDGNSDLQPDWLWSKRRDSAAPHYLFDSTRGVNSSLSSDDLDAEDTATGYLASFDSDGFTTGSDSALAYNGRTYVAWQWKANGGTTSSNSSGSITSTVQANTTAGFSIVAYTGTGSTATVGHSLGVIPSWIIIKSRNTSSRHWSTYHSSLGATKYVFLDDTDTVITSSSRFNDTAPTSSVFTVKTDGDVNGNGTNHIAYCFAEIQGYSKFGSYEANASADGPFIYTGFKPALILFKNIDNANNWVIHDNKRGAFNVNDEQLSPNNSNAEATDSAKMDFLSNGFKIRVDSQGVNNSGHTIIYMAFAHHPFVSSEGVPVTAK